jgi:hypothetical protein
MATIYGCAEEQRPLPVWAAQELFKIRIRWQAGELKSWEDVFGKPFRGKTLKGTRTYARRGEVLIEVGRLLNKPVKNKEGRPKKRPVDDDLFGKVGKKLKMSKSAVNRLYYGEDAVRKERLQRWLRAKR